MKSSTRFTTSPGRSATRRIAHLTLLVGLLVGCMTPGERIVDMEDNPAQTARLDTLVLSDIEPTARLALDEETLQPNPAVLEIPIVQIDNAALIPFSVFAFFEWNDEAGVANRVLIGNFSVFPANQAGRFMLSTRDAFDGLHLARTTNAMQEVFLVLDMQPVSEARPLDAITVYVAPVAWRQDTNP